MTQFDPYLNWLGIPVHEQPPNFYRLLGVVLFESNSHVIEQAADRQSLAVGAYQSGVRGDLCQRLLSEIAMARYSLLDPQQKASYDSHLQETLAHRGERTVMSPPPPSGYAPQQSYNPPAQQAPAQRMPMQQPPMAQPVPMHGGPQMMSAPPGYRTAMPAAMAAPVAAAIPVAAPFPVAPRAAAPAAPVPPAAPQRPIDELESLASQPTRRRHASKRKKKDYTKEVVIGSVIAGLAVILVIVFIAANSSNRAPSGFQGISNEGGNSQNSNLPSAVVNKAKEDKKKVASDSSKDGQEGSLRKVDEESKSPKKSRKPANETANAKTPETPPSKLRPLDPDAAAATANATPAAAPAPTQEAEAKIPPREHVIPPQVHDTPQDLGGDLDPVMELPKPGEVKPDDKDK